MLDREPQGALLRRTEEAYEAIRKDPQLLTKPNWCDLKIIHRTWNNMISRCTNPKSTSYPNYGGRGIRVCDAWLASFDAFASHMGPRPTAGHSIDRINNDGNYEPGNVRWATATVQQNNRRNNHRFFYRGETLTLQQWATRLGFTSHQITSRIREGLSFEQAVSYPAERRNVAPVDLTSRQQQLFAFIAEYTRNNGGPPSLREIGAEFGINSTNGVACCVRSMEKKGFVRVRRNVSRGIFLTEKGTNFMKEMMNATR